MGFVEEDKEFTGGTVRTVARDSFRMVVCGHGLSRRMDVVDFGGISDSGDGQRVRGGVEWRTVFDYFALLARLCRLIDIGVVGERTFSHVGECAVRDCAVCCPWSDALINGPGRAP